MTAHDSLLDRITRAEHVTLEIGPGREPLFGAKAQMFDESHLYVGLNIDPLQHEWLSSYAIGDSKGKVAVLAPRALDGGIAEIPLMAQSVDAVHISNVFGEPDNPCIMLEFWDENHVYHGHSGESAKLAMLPEVWRVLRTAGELVIIEDLTPYGDDSSRGHQKPRYEKLVGILKDRGFSIVSVAGDPESFRSAAARFRDEDYYDLQDPLSYLIKATKLA